MATAQNGWPVIPLSQTATFLAPNGKLVYCHPAARDILGYLAWRWHLSIEPLPAATYNEGDSATNYRRGVRDGLVALVPQIFSGIRGLLDGRHAREKQANVDALSQRDAAIRDRDQADRCRRALEDYASRVRRICIEHGLGHLLPPWPGERDNIHPPLPRRPDVDPPGDGQPDDITT